MTKKEIKLLAEITYMFAWRCAVGLFAIMGFANWWFDVIVGG